MEKEIKITTLKELVGIVNQLEKDEEFMIYVEPEVRVNVKEESEEHRQ